MKKMLLIIMAVMTACFGAQAQVMKSADLEKYAKARYGDKWLDAAMNLASGLTLDKNESLTYQQVIEAPGKTKQQLYVALNYWATATFKDHQAITLNDKEAGCIIISSTIADIANHMGTLNKYSVSITPVIRLDIKDGKVRVTYTVQNYDILTDISGGWLSLAESNKNTYGDSMRKKDDKAVTTLKEMHALDSKMTQVQRISQISNSLGEHIHKMTNEELVDLEIDPQANLDANTFRIVDIKGERYGVGAAKTAYTGVFPVVVTSPMALYYQGSIQNTGIQT